MQSNRLRAAPVALAVSRSSATGRVEVIRSSRWFFLHPLKELKMRALMMGVAAVALSCLSLPTSANAAWISGSTGTGATSPGTTTPNDSTTVFYAVYNNTDGSFTTYLTTTTAGKAFATALAISGINLTTLENDKYVYFYELANPKGSDVTEFQVANPGAMNTVGRANGYVFSQNGKNVNGQSGSGNATTLSPSSGTPSSANSSSNLTFTTASGATAITSEKVGTFRTSSTSIAGDPAERFTINSGNGFSTYTSLIVVGSNYGPANGEVQTTDDGYAQSNSVPVPTPEPGTIALLGLTLPIFGWGYIRRLRQNRAVVAAAAQ